MTSIRKEQEKFIKEKAEEICYKYNKEQYSYFPVDNLLKDYTDLSIDYGDGFPDNVSGAIRYQDNRFHIYINNSKSKVRQHFTLGHELGHYFLHKDRIKNKGEEGIIDIDNILYRADNIATNEIELEANEFSGNLLMPEQEVRFYYNLLNKNTKQISEVFGVSELAMSVRLAKLKLIE